jgi:hypothetical protein
MINNPWINNSGKIYRSLLRLYPQEHRKNFGAPMQQVFNDQCHCAYQQKGVLGIFLLWLRILPDLGYTVLLEHSSSKQTSWGLIEPVPNAPLPWKGVFLVLLPGMVYLVSQIAQLNGEAWYLTVYYRAAFFLILPVLAFWGITRRFPIWGLIPLGLFFRLAQQMLYQLTYLPPNAFSSNPLINNILAIVQLFPKDHILPIILFSLAILWLGWRYLHQQGVRRVFWILTGVYLLIVLGRVFNDVGWGFLYYKDVPSDKLISSLNVSIIWNLYDFTGFLLLIFLGTLLTRRHGFNTILVPIGYILPVILVGIYDDTNMSMRLAAISMAVLAYRLLLAFITPLWISRAASQAWKKWAVFISVAVALGIHAILQFYPLWSNIIQSYPSTQGVINLVLDEAKTISAFLLAIIMYQNTQPVEDSPAPFLVGVPTPEHKVPNVF